MSSWLDRWARRVASPAADASPPMPIQPLTAKNPPQPDSRRAFLKKAAVVGGAAWSVPVMQTALAPAASASTTVIGSACTTSGAPCGDGSICFNSICGAPGATCSGGQPCFNSACSGSVCGGPGATCTANSSCASGTCGSNGRCKN